LAAEVATIQDGDVEEGRKVLAFLHASFESFDADNAFDPEVPQELSDAAGRGGAENAESEFREHGREKERFSWTRMDEAEGRTNPKTRRGDGRRESLKRKKRAKLFSKSAAPEAS
jgi:hypothetical protein